MAPPTSTCTAIVPVAAAASATDSNNMLVQLRHRVQPADQVFVRDETHEWLPGTVLEVNGTKALVQVEVPVVTTGENSVGGGRLDHCWIDTATQPLPRQNTQIGRDMAELPFLHEAAILYQLAARHAQQQPYTRVGDMVVAVNPCTWIPELYTPRLQILYAKTFVWQAPSIDLPVAEDEKKAGDIDIPFAPTNALVTSSSTFTSIYDRLGFEPHIYEVSSLAYRGLLLEQQDQSILVSGESGAGKTETVKLVLQHLATMEDAVFGQSGSQRGLTHGELITPAALAAEETVRLVLATSPIFEAFGNAQTLQNCNSSRFGKVTQLHFTPAQSNEICRLQGSSSITYLLETNRAVTQTPGERNFHIFYQMLAAPREFKQKYLGDEWADAKASDFACLNEVDSFAYDGKDDAQLWHETHTALDLFRVRAEAMQTLMEALSVVLLLSNLSFTEEKDEVARISSRFELDRVSQAMGVDADELEAALTTFSLSTDKETVITPRNTESALDACSSLAKKIYAATFASIVKCVNSKTMATMLAESPPDDTTQTSVVSLLDIYGFEKTDHNQFDQLCINYANEKLQHKYVYDNLRRCRAEYAQEGIELFDFAIVDNSDIVDLLEAKAGMIDLLNDECCRPRGTAEAFVANLKQNHHGHTRLLHHELHAKTEFGIQHFADAVQYDANMFVRRNMDRLCEDLVNLGLCSTNDIVGAEFEATARAEAAATENDGKKIKGKATVLQSFRGQLKDLIESMNRTQTRYIRCMKPNEQLQVGQVNNRTMMRQLKCAGLVTAIDLSRESFPNKLPFKTLSDRFMCIMSKRDQANLREMPVHDQVQLMLTMLFAPMMEQFRMENFTMPFACGKTKAFFRAGALEVIEQQRQDYLNVHAVIIQARWRGQCARCSRQRLVAAVTALQATHRAMESRLEYGTVKRAAKWLQSRHHSSKQRLLFQQQREACVAVQTWWRMLRSMGALDRAHNASTVISKTYRGSLLRSLFAQQRQRIVQLQAIRRMKLAQGEAESKRVADALLEDVHRPCSPRTDQPSPRSSKTGQYPWQRQSSSRSIEDDAVSVQVSVAGNVVETVRASLDVPRDDASGSSSNDATPVDPTLLTCTTCTNCNGVNKTRRWEHDSRIKRLETEVEMYRSQAQALREDITVLASEAEAHKQEVEADFEDRLADYEDEVLQLKNQLQSNHAEKEDMEKALAEQQAKHDAQMDKMKQYILLTQLSHKEYLDKVQNVLESVNQARKAETAQISNELAALRAEKSKRVTELEAQVLALQNQQSAPASEQLIVYNGNLMASLNQVQSLAAELSRLLTPEHLIQVVQDARHRSTNHSAATPEAYINQCVTHKAHQALDHIVNAVEKMAQLEQQLHHGSRHVNGSAAATAARELHHHQQRAITAPVQQRDARQNDSRSPTRFRFKSPTRFRRKHIADAQHAEALMGV